MFNKRFDIYKNSIFPRKYDRDTLRHFTFQLTLNKIRKKLKAKRGDIEHQRFFPYSWDLNGNYVTNSI